jgi:hypothetical protein
MSVTPERVLVNLTQIAELAADGDVALRSVIAAINEILTHDSASDLEKQGILREALDLDTLMSPDVAGSTQLCRQIKNTMLLIGLTPGDDVRRKKLCIRLAEGLHDAEFVNEAEAILASSRAGSALNLHRDENVAGQARRVGAHSTQINREYNLFSIAKAMGSRYSDATRYSGDISNAETVPFKVFRASYLTALEELGVPHEHRAPLIHHALKGSALDFYHENLQGKVTQLAEMFSALQEKFLNESVKLGIRAKLISLRLGDIQTAGNYTKVEAIEAVKKTICTMSQQGQDEYKTDAAMIDVLERHVLLEETWSADIAARRATQVFTFDSYCTSLTSWIRAMVEKGGEKNGHGYFGKPSENSLMKPPGIFYGEQYNARRSGHASKYKPYMRGTSQLTFTPRKGNCHRCGKSGHWMAGCPDRGRGGMSHLDALHARVKDAGGGSSGTAQVLFELATELDAIELDHEENASYDGADCGEESLEPSSNVFEEFFLKERDSNPAKDFRQSRA